MKILRQREKDLLVIVPEHGRKRKTPPKYLVGEIDRDDMMIGVRDPMQ